MPGQRRTAGPRASGSWTPRLTGIGVAVVVAAALVTGYLLAFHPAVIHPAARLPTKVISYQTVGLVVADTEPGSSSDQFLQLVSRHSTPEFSPVPAAQLAEGSPQWTADLMAGGTYIFIYLPTGQCLSAAGTVSRPRLALLHCDLSAAQRWRRRQPAILSQAHDFYQYANFGQGSCLTRTDGIIGATLARCSASKPADQFIGFWWSSV
jgi:hypothetical protein